MTIKDKFLAAFEGRKNQTFRPHEIIDLIHQKFPDTNKGSINLADKCYNRINKDKNVEKPFRSGDGFHVFESLEDGSYKYLGQGYPYSGPIYWLKNIVGEWSNGKIVRLDELKNKMAQ